MTEELRIRFEREMMRLYEEPKKRFGYNATYFLQMIQDLGAIEAARKLISDPTFHEGLTKLWEKGALDLSVEALAVQDPWNQFFPEEELETARKKLRDLNYQV